MRHASCLVCRVWSRVKSVVGQGFKEARGGAGDRQKRKPWLGCSSPSGKRFPLQAFQRKARGTFCKEQKGARVFDSSVSQLFCTRSRRWWAESRVNQGLGRFGAYHVKELVVNRHTLFVGSANFTTNSRSNRERCYRMAGIVVAQAVSDLTTDRIAGCLWTP